MTFEEKTISSQLVYEGAILNLRKDKVYVVGNKVSYREIVEHNGGVTLAAVTEDKKIVMVKQFRKSIERVILEVPAGKIEKGEDPQETALRELKEETGYTAANITRLAEIYPSVGYSQELLHIYLCTGLTPGETEFDDNEALDIVEYDFMEMYDMVVSGQIDDGKTVAAVLLAKPQLEKEGLL